MGPNSGYLWVLPDAISGNIAGVQATAEDQTSPKALAVGGLTAVLTGSIGSVPLSPSGTFYDAWQTRYAALTSTVGTCGAAPSVLTGSCACDVGTDYSGDYLWRRDDDGNATTPDKCVGFDFSADSPNSYAYYAYDAVYAYAYAAQKVIDTAGSTAFTGANLMNALKNVSFTGLTGKIEFENSGDREVGAGFTISNHDGTNFVTKGNWDTSTGFVASAGSDISTFTWATSDNSQPLNIVVKLILDEEKNLLPEGLTMIGMLLVFANYLVAIVFGAMTFMQRKHKVIRASQVRSERRTLDAHTVLTPNASVFAPRFARRTAHVLVHDPRRLLRLY